MIDLSNCKIDPFRAYDGKNGSKICVIYNGDRYMVKFPAHAKDNPQMRYSNGCLNEHIASSIYNSLNIVTHQTMLATYKGKEVVACKDFCDVGEHIASFAMVKNQVVDSTHHGFGTELSSVLEAMENQQIYDPQKIKTHFWNMFAADALLGNFDRHNGNWGVIVNEAEQSVRIAPVYDNGSCLYPQLTDEQMKKVLSDRSEIESRLYVFPNSALKMDDKKINYFDFLAKTKDKDCIQSLISVYNSYDSEKVNKILNETPMSNTKRIFYKTMVEERFHGILERALDLQKENCIKLGNGKYISKDMYNLYVKEGIIAKEDLFREKRESIITSRVQDEPER